MRKRSHVPKGASLQIVFRKEFFAINPICCVAPATQGLVQMIPMKEKIVFIFYSSPLAVHRKENTYKEQPNTGVSVSHTAVLFSLATGRENKKLRMAQKCAAIFARSTDGIPQFFQPNVLHPATATLQ